MTMYRAAPADVARPDYLTRLADSLDRQGVVLHAALVAALLALFAMAAHLLTLEADEAWILLSTAHAFGVPLPPTSALSHPVLTTGGPHLLIHGLLDQLTMSLPVHRTVSVAAAAGLLVGAYALFRRFGHSSTHAAAGTALVAATPGFVLQAGLATGEVIAAVFLLAAAVHWTARGERSTRAATLTGFLLGSAIAARVNCFVAVPALLLYSAVSDRASARRIGRALLAGAVAAVVAAGSTLLYSHTAQAAATGQAAFFSRSTGVGNVRRSVFQVLQSLSVVNSYAPFPMLMALAGAWLVSHRRTGRDTDATNLAGLLLVIGAAMLAAAVLFAPIMHLRYFWPALLCIWIAGAVLLLDAWRTSRSPITRLTIHAVTAIAATYALLAGSSMLASGETLLLVYQANGLAPLSPPSTNDRFRAGLDQHELARFIGSQKAVARFFAMTAPTSYPLIYLAGRPIEGAEQIRGSGEQYVLLEPSDYAIWRPEPAFGAWLTRWTDPAFRAGTAAAFRIRPGAPPPPSRVSLIGSNDFY